MGGVPHRGNRHRPNPTLKTVSSRFAESVDEVRLARYQSPQHPNAVQELVSMPLFAPDLPSEVDRHLVKSAAV